jgi:hypothetical protein
VKFVRAFSTTSGVRRTLSPSNRTCSASKPIKINSTANSSCILPTTSNRVTTTAESVQRDPNNISIPKIPINNPRNTETLKNFLAEEVIAEIEKSTNVKKLLLDLPPARSGLKNSMVLIGHPNSSKRVLTRGSGSFNSFKTEITLRSYKPNPVAFAIIGLGVWLLFVKKINWQSWIPILLAGLASSFVCVALDKWFYGTWVCTPYNYYFQNITNGAAANSGVSPWWYYSVMFFEQAVPPISIVLLMCFAIGIYLQPKSVFSFSILVFLVGHFLVGHKEMRFLFPMWFAMIYLFAIGLEFLLSKFSSNKFVKIVM